MMLAILTVIGTRPQFIKAAAVSQALRTRSNLREIIVHTGQHFDDNMSRQFFDELSGEELARCRTLRLGPFPVPPHKNCS